MKRYTLAVLVGLVLGISLPAVQAQQRNNRADMTRMADPSRDMLRRGETVFAEAFVLPADTGDGYRVEVLLRLAWDFIVFTRTTSTHPDSLYDAAFDVTFDLRGGGEATVQSVTDRARVSTGDYAATNTRDRFVLLRRSFPVMPGNWTLGVHIEDRTSSRTRSLSLPVRVPTFDTDISRMLSLVPLATAPLAPSKPMLPYGFGGSLPFSTSGSVAVVAHASDEARWQWMLVQHREDAEPDTILRASIAPFMIVPTLAAPHGGGRVERFVLESRAHTMLRTFAFLIPVDTIDAGSYTLHLVMRDGAQQDTLTQPLRVLWRDMPLSLRDPDLAAVVMRHVLSEEEISALGRLSGAAKERWIRNWWRERDPDPRTRFNEHMNEYFRRADVAYYRYQMLGVSNGAITDRGKVYILHGEPDIIDRSLTPGGLTEEFWTYSSINKSFRFTDTQRNGNLRLTRQGNDI